MEDEGHEKLWLYKSKLGHLRKRDLILVAKFTTNLPFFLFQLMGLFCSFAPHHQVCYIFSLIMQIFFSYKL